MTKKKDVNPWLLACGLLLFVPLLILRGYVLVQLWQWFAVPLGVPAIELWHACGISALASTLTQSRWVAAVLHGLDQRDENTKLSQSLTVDIVVPLVTWGAGAVLHVLM